MSQPLSFLFVSSDTYPPFRADVAILFGEELSKRGHQIDWLLPSEAACEKSFSIAWGGGTAWVGSTEKGSSRYHRLCKHLRDLGNDLRMFRLLKKKRYDFIQVKDKFVSALFAILASKIHRTRFIYWLSYPFPEASIYLAREGIARYPWFYLVRGLLFKFLLYKIIMPNAVHVFVQSEQMKKDVVAMGIPARKLTAVPMGVSPEKIAIHAGACHETDERLVVYLGTLNKTRRLDFVVTVFKKVLKVVPDAKLLFVGGGDDPSDEALLKAEVDQRGMVGSVSFTGFVPMDTAWGHVKRAAVCISPFYPTPILNSTSPTKLIEYMAIGKPVVANDHPEQRMVISESGAGICVPYEEEAFAAAIVELLLDPVRARVMGEKGRRYVEGRRTYKVIADMVESRYCDVCEKN